MDKNIFEDRILDYLDGSMDFKERKEFESFLNDNDSYKSMVNDIQLS
jgi:anti-sigma factor RsiW